MAIYTDNCSSPSWASKVIRVGIRLKVLPCTVYIRIIRSYRVDMASSIRASLSYKNNTWIHIAHVLSELVVENYDWRWRACWGFIYVNDPLCTTVLRKNTVADLNLVAVSHNRDDWPDLHLSLAASFMVWIVVCERISTSRRIQGLDWVTIAIAHNIWMKFALREDNCSFEIV